MYIRPSICYKNKNKHTHVRTHTHTHTRMGPVKGCKPTHAVGGREMSVKRANGVSGEVKSRLLYLCLSLCVSVSDILGHLYMKTYVSVQAGFFTEAAKLGTDVGSWSPKATDKPRGAFEHPARPWKIPSCQERLYIYGHIQGL